ncbi:hypothetical protein Tco_1578902, partial [Tanacetum coccineum]
VVADEDDDSDVDLFGEETEEEKKVAKERAAAVKASGIHYKKLALDNRIPLALFQSLSASDYVDAQRFSMTTPMIHLNVLSCGESDLEVTGTLLAIPYQS